ncbi:MAG: hypothetical protein LBC13_02165 [Clostridiales bacterium]|jgi:hypothetical protein|nr:hypothetical protein [Clostridiales bacterium]
MELKNTTTVMFANFKLVYRIIAYLFIVFLVLGAISLSLFLPAQRHVLARPDVKDEIEAIREETGSFLSDDGEYGTGGLISSVAAHISNIFNAIKTDTGFLAAAIALLVCIYFLGYFLISLIDLPMAGVLNAFMSSALSESMLGYTVKDFKISLKYALANTIVGAPFHILIVLIVYAVITLLFPVMNVAALALALLAGVTLLSIKSALCAGWLPALIFSEDKRVWKAFKIGIQLFKTRFRDICGVFTIAVFVVYMLIAAFAVVTFGIMIVVSFALLLLFRRAAELIFYYVLNGRRFYVDAKTIVDSRALANRTELQEDI